VSPVDPNTIGIAITSLIGSLGAAGAAVAVTYYFLAYLRDETDRHKQEVELLETRTALAVSFEMRAIELEKRVAALEMRAAKLELASRYTADPVFVDSGTTAIGRGPK
jgi:hypothetical protein